MAKLYNFDYDLFIIDALNEGKRLRFTEIQKVVEKRIHRKISPDTINYHIKKLKSHEYIRLYTIEGKRGKSKHYCLTNLTKQNIELGILFVNYDPKANPFTSEHAQNIRSIAYFITICSLTNPEMSLIIDNPSLDYGLSAKDISEYYGGGFGFGYLRIRKEIIQKTLLLLYEQGLLKRVQRLDSEDRFRISDKVLYSFIHELNTLYRCAIFPRLVLNWTHVSHPKPKERFFFHIHYGKKNSSERINHFKELFDNNKHKDTFRDDLKIWKIRIDTFDYNIKEAVNALKLKYSTLIEKYSSITNILLEVFYPLFMRNTVESIEHKHKGKKYLKLLMIDINSITISQDEAKIFLF